MSGDERFSVLELLANCFERTFEGKEGQMAAAVGAVSVDAIILLFMYEFIFSWLRVASPRE